MTHGTPGETARGPLDADTIDAPRPDAVAGAGAEPDSPPPGATPEPGADPRVLLRRARLPLLVLGALLALALVTVVVGGRTRAGLLDPAATDPGGSAAVARLLEARGVDVTQVGDTGSALAGGPGATVVLPFPGRVGDADLARLAAGGQDVVLIGPDDAALERLAPGVTVAGSTGATVREPRCDLPAARTAGAVQIGGLSLDTAGAPGAVACYEAAGGALLVEVERAGGGTTTVLGDGLPLTNGALATEGNAALALLLLGGGEEVRWLLPAVGATAPEQERGLLDLLPAPVRTALLVVVLAVVLTAAWRGRRLGPVVPEPLPVAVRAAETVEGRARLYRAARARGRAATALRAAAAARLGPLSGAGPDPAPGPLTAAVTEHARLDPAEVSALLYGPEPRDDRALVALATALDGLERRVREGRAGPVGGAAGAGDAAEGGSRDAEDGQRTADREGRA